MALTDIQKVRLEVADNDPAIPLLSDDEYSYFLEKSNNNIVRAAIDAAKTILLKLSQRTNQTVDIFTLSGGSKSAEQYRLALELFLKDPQLNPVLTNCQGYFGNVSISDMQANDSTADNNIVTSPSNETRYVSTSNYFGV